MESGNGIRVLAEAGSAAGHYIPPRNGDDAAVSYDDASLFFNLISFIFFVSSLEIAFIIIIIILKNLYSNYMIPFLFICNSCMKEETQN